MSKQLNKSRIILLAGLIVLSLSCLGCGGNPVSDTGLNDQQNYDTGSTIGDFNNNPADAYSNNQNTQTGSYNPNDTMNQPVNVLTANVMSKDTSGIWLWKKATGTIMVTNSSQTPASGTLNITFTLKGETAESQQQSLSLSAGESKQIEVKASKHSDDVTASITPDNTQAAYGTQIGSQYGQY